MGYSHDDWLRDQGILPGINLDRIRFGHRVERRKPLSVSYMGQPVARSESPPKKRRVRRDDEPGYERFQLRLW